MSDDETPIDLSRLLGNGIGSGDPGTPNRDAADGRPDAGQTAAGAHGGHGGNEEWGEALARSVDHLY